MSVQPHVGTLGEKPLHAALKRWYAEPGDRIEEPVEGFVADIVRGDLLIEIQTASFSSMKRKLLTLLDDYEIRLVYPIAVEKWIVKIDDEGDEISRRKSPRRGSALDLFGELVSFPSAVAHHNFSLEVLLTQQEEIRRFDPNKAWRRKGWVVDERRLIEVVDWVLIDSTADLAAMLPSEVPAEFSTADLADNLRCTRRLAQQMAYCLRHAGAIDQVDKTGNAMIYARR